MIKSVSQDQLKSMRHRLNILYGGEAEKLLERIFMMIGRYGVGNIEARSGNGLWNEGDNVLITYADSIQDNSAESPLHVLGEFCRLHLKGSIKSVHLLPFYPWSSDDGFSVINYREVDESSGTWEGVHQLAKDFDLMFDLVLNHCSARSSWFKDFVAGIEPARHYFLEMDPEQDFSKVVRPRTSPLLTKTRTRDGHSHVWTTFSSDQVDLNWQNPEVLIEFIDILMFYIANGMRIARLDAVAFLWKKLGTNCLHLPETHQVVKLLRDLVEIIAPQTILLTETNVPHEENVSYFGNGDEAHMVYQFALPPLLLHGLATGNAQYLTSWAKDLKPPPANCTFFNFTASHDGIGVRPIEGLLPQEEKQALINHVKRCGGKLNYRVLADGSEQVYEMNVTYFSALAYGSNKLMGARRFLCSQALALSLKGIPGIYIHSLLATENDSDAVESTGINRRINRHKWQFSELKKHLKKKYSGYVFETYLRMIRRRSLHPAFHPDSTQDVISLRDTIFSIIRTSVSGDETILCLFNFQNRSQTFVKDDLPKQFSEASTLFEVLKDELLYNDNGKIQLEPYQAMWLVPRN